MKDRLGSIELSSLMTVVMCIKLIFSFPRHFIMTNGNSAWIFYVPATLVMLLLFALMAKIYTTAERRTAIELAEYLGGRGLKIIVWLILLLVFIAASSSNIRHFIEMVKTSMLQDTNSLVVSIVLGTGIILGAYNGIEALGRCAAFFVCAAGGAIILFICLLVPEFDVRNIYPIDFKSNFTAGMGCISMFSDLLILNLIMSHSDSMAAVKKAGYISIIVAGVIGFMITLGYSLIYPYPASGDFISPMYQLSRIVKIGDYFERTESLFQFVWSFGMFLYGAVYLFMMCDITRETFKLSNYRPILCPLYVIILSVSYIPSSMQTLLAAEYLTSGYILLASVLIPAIVTLLAILKKHIMKKRSRISR